jgi:hypothetical protein
VRGEVGRLQLVPARELVFVEANTFGGRVRRLGDQLQPERLFEQLHHRARRFRRMREEADDAFVQRPREIDRARGRRHLAPQLLRDHQLQLGLLFARKALATLLAEISDLGLLHLRAKDGPGDDPAICPEREIDVLVPEHVVVRELDGVRITNLRPAGALELLLVRLERLHRAKANGAHEFLGPFLGQLRCHEEPRVRE